MYVHLSASMRDWLFHLLETTPHEEYVEILLMLWAIWTARRKAIHKAIYQSPVTVRGFVTSLLEELQLVTDQKQSKQELGAKKKHQPSQAWIAPPLNFMKLNVDGGVAKVQGKGAAVVVCRSAEGVYQGSSARVFDGITDPPLLEALACCEAMALAKDLGIQKLGIASDASDVIKAIKHGSRCSCSSVLKEIEHRRQDFQVVEFVHEGRECNTHAHNLVRSALFLDHGRYVWLLEPWDVTFVPLFVD